MPNLLDAVGSWSNIFQVTSIVNQVSRDVCQAICQESWWNRFYLIKYFIWHVMHPMYLNSAKASLSTSGEGFIPTKDCGAPSYSDFGACSYVAEQGRYRTWQFIVLHQGALRQPLPLQRLHVSWVCTARSPWSLSIIV